jgi:hypothetical protein
MRFNSNLAETLPVSHHGAQSDLARRLDQARSIIETKFLAAGNMLFEAVGDVGTLIASLEQLAKALDPEIVADTSRELQAAADQLSALPGVHDSRQAAIERLGAAQAVLRAETHAIRLSLAYMRAFTVNIKITAGGLPPGAEFSVFAQDIEQGIERAGKELAQLEGDLRALEDRLSRARLQGAELGGRIRQLFPAAPEELVISIKLMSDHQTHIAQIAERAAALARDIKKRVSRALGALQIGDITRQRIEHVQSGLNALDAGFIQAPPETAAQATALMHVLLAAQLAATAADFGREVGEIDGNMAEMASGAGELLRLRDLTYGRTDRGGQGFLSGLEARIAQAHALVEEMRVADGAALQTGRATAASVQELTQRVAAIRMIKTEVQYMAINTTLKCRRVGEAGKPLAVIAVELRDHGLDLEKSAGVALGALDELTRSAALLEAASNAGEGRASENAAVAIGVAAARIHQARTQSDSDLAALASQSEAVLARLTQSTQRLGFRREIGDILDEAAAALDGLAAPAQPFTRETAQALGGLIDAVAASYTMAQERDIHQAFLSAWGADAWREAPVVALKATADELDEVLF